MSALLPARNPMPNHSDHMDAQVTVRQTATTPVILQALALLGGLAFVYATSVANDREQVAQITAVRADVARLERASVDVRGEIRGELVEIRNELRELRNVVIAGTKK